MLQIPGNKTHDVATIALDSCRLVGREIKLFSQQFPGKELKTKVLGATDNLLITEGGGRFELVGNLVNHQQVVIQFPYKGQDISVKAQLQRNSGGQCRFILEDTATPLSQRRYRRVQLPIAVRLAAFPLTGFRAKPVSQLRWLETDLIDFSSGGLRVAVPAILRNDICLLINLELHDLPFPKLMLAQVRHCYEADDRQYRAGVEFVIREKAGRLASAPSFSQLPRSVLSYCSKDRENLNKMIITWMNDRVGAGPQIGAENEN